MTFLFEKQEYALDSANIHPTEQKFLDDPQVEFMQFRFPHKKHSVFTTVYTKANPKADLLLIHGLNDHGGFYSKYIAADLLDAGYRLIVPDLLAFGRTATKKNFGLVPALDEYSELCYSILTELQPKLVKTSIGKVFLLGTSLGGMIVLNYSAKYGDKGLISGVIPVCPLVSIAADSKPSSFLINFVKCTLRIAPFMAGVPIAPGVKGNLSKDPIVDEEFQADTLHYLGDVKMASGLHMINACDEIVAKFPLITIPILILHGDKDRATSHDGSVLLHQKVGSADRKFILYEGIEHVIFHEEKKGIQDIVAWLDARAQ